MSLEPLIDATCTQSYICIYMLSEQISDTLKAAPAATCRDAERRMGPVVRRIDYDNRVGMTLSNYADFPQENLHASDARERDRVVRRKKFSKNFGAKKQLVRNNSSL